MNIDTNLLLQLLLIISPFFLIGFLLIKKVYSSEKKAKVNIEQIKKVTSNGVPIEIGTASWVSKKTPSITFVYSHNFNTLVLYPDSIVYGVFGTNKSMLSEIEEVDIFSSSWRLGFGIVPWVVVTKTPSVVVKFRNNNKAFTFSLWDNSQFTAVLQFFYDKNVTLSKVALEKLI